MSIAELVPITVPAYESPVVTARGTEPDEDESIVEGGVLVALGVVLAVFATVAAWCLAVCWGPPRHCDIHFSWSHGFQAHVDC